MAIITPGDFAAQANQNKPVLANVGGKPITAQDVDRFLAAMGPQGQAYNNPPGRAAILEQLIAQRLFLLDAQRNLFERDPAFKEQLAAVKEQLLMEYAIAKCVDSIKVSDDEVKAYYEAHKDELQAGETVNASHILVDSAERANELLTAIQSGEITFEDAARENSSCPSSAQGGSLGDFERGQMVPEFDQAVFDMAEGEVRGPVQTQFGYHLIRLNKKQGAQPLDYQAIKNELQAQVLRERQQAAYQSKINQLKILYPVDKF